MTPILCWFMFLSLIGITDRLWEYFLLDKQLMAIILKMVLLQMVFFADYNPATLPKCSALLITAVQEFNINKNVFHKSQKIIKTKNPVGTSDSVVWGDKGRW